MRFRLDPQRIILGILAPVVAILIAALFTSIVLIVAGKSPLTVVTEMISYGSTNASQVAIINKAVTYYFAGVAVAIGFRMNLFNIGVDGQYRLAALAAAAIGAWLALPALIQIPLIIAIAMAVGAAWAFVAAFLKTSRGVSEVISTIMLNAIAAAIIDYLVNPKRLAHQPEGSSLVETRPLPPSGRFPGLPLPEGVLNGFLIIAILVGIGYWLLLNRTRFGFDLRAAGRSESAAVASGVNAKRMILYSMLISGAVAGLVGLPLLMGEKFSYGQDFPAGYGFTGIAVALLGRNHPVGIAIGALLWSFLERASLQLDIIEVPAEIVLIMQGLIVLAVVIAYELVRRYSQTQQRRRVASELRATGGNANAEGAPA